MKVVRSLLDGMTTGMQSCYIKLRVKDRIWEIIKIMTLSHQDLWVRKTLLSKSQITNSFGKYMRKMNNSQREIQSKGIYMMWKMITRYREVRQQMVEEGL